MTTLSEFSAYYLRSIWREGDAALTADLPRLIKEAEARISRDLRDANLIATTTIGFPIATDSLPLPPDFRELVSVDFYHGISAQAVSYPTLMRIREFHRQYENDPVMYYAIQGGRIHFSKWMEADEPVVASSPSNPSSIYAAAKLAITAPGVVYSEATAATITYHRGITPMNNTDEVSFYDLHPDFFLAAVHVQAYSYMRDFELSAEYNTKYANLLEDMRRQSNYTMYPSGQLGSPLTAGIK